MGNQSSRGVRRKTKIGASGTKYDEKEIGILDQIFHEMAVRSPDDTIAKDTFLKFFDLPGVLGDRLFEVFDTKKTGVIDFEEFIDGFQRFSRGDPTTKMDMLFQLFDLDGKGGITKDELSTVLMSIIIPPNQVVGRGGIPPTSPILKAATSNHGTPHSHGAATPHSPKTTNLSPPPGTPSFDPANSAEADEEDKPAQKNDGNSFILESKSFISEMKEGEPLNIDQVQKKVDEIVKQAFDECDVDNSSRLDAQEFRMWIANNAQIMEACEELFVQLAWNGPQMTLRNNFNMEKAEWQSQRYDTVNNTLNADTLRGILETSSAYTQCSGDCKLRFVTAREKIPPPPENKEEKEKELQYDYVILAHSSNMSMQFNFCPKCGKKLKAPDPVKEKSSMSLPSMDAMALSSNVPGMKGMKSSVHSHKGNLKMDVGKFRQLKTRHIVLHGKFVYIYKSEAKPFPDTVVFIQGYFAELTKSQKFPNFHYIRLNPPNGSSGKAVHFYCDSAEEANKWVDALEVAAQTVSITKYYQLGELLGKGSFASVCQAKEKSTGRRVAVKIIEKKVIDGKQKEYIRIEMSVMKLVRHPNVMRLEQVFETKTKIYMVMPLYLGGDLYEYMKHNARHGLKEDEARQVIYNVLSALKYLHSVGIVHRDLKPENLLLVREHEPTNIVITDFGLSKFAAPHEAMKAACGTLSYVAPEVLRMEGYGKEVDLWSTGVIMFLTLRAKLPFHDTTKNRIIARILRQNVQMVDPHWQKISKEAKDLISKLLIKHPAQRITCDNGLKHSWFEPILEARQQQQEVLDAAKAAESKKEPELYPDQTGTQSVKDIKVYSRDAVNENDDEEEDEEDEESEDDDSAPITVIRQTSIHKPQYNPDM